MTLLPPSAPPPPSAPSVPFPATVSSRSAGPFLVAVCNHKGGVAKTTTCVNLAVGLAAAGQTVAVVDFDSLATATRALGASAARIGTYEVMTGRCPVDEALYPTAQAGVWVVPATAQLHLAEVEPEVIGLAPERLRARIGETRRCDTMLIDCPPALGVIAVNAIAAADLILVPVQPTTFAREGLEKTLEIIAACRVGRPESPPRILITMADLGDATIRRVIEQIRQDHGDRVYATPIPFDPYNETLVANGQILLAEAPETPGATAYLRVTLALIRDQRLLRSALPALAVPTIPPVVALPHPPPSSRPPPPEAEIPPVPSPSLGIAPPEPVLPTRRFRRPGARVWGGVGLVVLLLVGLGGLALWQSKRLPFAAIGPLFDRPPTMLKPTEGSFSLTLPIPSALPRIPATDVLPEPPLDPSLPATASVLGGGSDPQPGRSAP